MTHARETVARPGFSMLELVVVIAVMGILLAIAVPTYSKYAQRAHRADAIRAMLAVASCQEKIRMNSGFYDTTRCVHQGSIASYRIGIEPSNVAATDGFTVFAEPLRNRENDCGILSMDHNGSRGISGDSTSLTACWSGR